MYPITLEESRADILARAIDLHNSELPDRDAMQPFHHRLRLFNLFCDAYHSVTQATTVPKLGCPYRYIYREHNVKRNNLYDGSMEMLARIKEEFPDVKIRVFHLPEKREIYTREYALDVSEDIKRLGLDYYPLLTDCHWSLSMFHKHDAHPNDSGYKQIARCVAKYIEEPLL